MPKSPYSEEFYKACIYSLKSAEIVVPVVLELTKPKSVIDIGCNRGEWLSVFNKHGVSDIFGVDGIWTDKSKLLIPNECFLMADLEKPLKIKRKFELVVSLEVAEHISKNSAETFIESLTNLGDVILFSAAIPFQEGDNHINEQWPKYWASIFAKRGYIPIDCIRKRIWNNDGVSFWYSQNTLLFVKNSHLRNNKILQDELKEIGTPVLSVVHPKFYLQMSEKVRRYNKIIKLIPSPIRRGIIKLKNFLK